MSSQPPLPLPSKDNNFKDDMHAIQTGYFYRMLVANLRDGEYVSPCVDDDTKATPLIRIESYGEIFYVKVCTLDDFPQEWL